MKDEIIVISLGGSLIIPDQIDLHFLKNFRELILEKVREGKKFVIITGGGKLCRRYQEAAKEITNPSGDDLDWIGIASLKLNAELMRVIFDESASDKIILNPSESFSFEKPIVIGAAYRPGGSTDWDSVLIAKTIKAKKIINLSNVDYVYDSDPKVNPKAKRFEKISWAEYRKLIPESWDPGFSSPFDPTASKLAEELGIEVVIMKGEPLSNLEKYLKEEKFKGTTIF
jgi:uridylate kinase